MIFTVSMCVATAGVVAMFTWWVQNRRADADGARLKQRLETIELSLANALAGTFVVHLKEGYIESSSASAQLIGMPPNTIRFTNEEWWTTVHADDRERVREFVADVLVHGNPYVLDYRANMKDGKLRWLRSHGLPIKNSAGRVHKIYGTLIDISDIKALERESQAREERLRDAAIAARFTIWQLDLDANTYTSDRPAPKKRNVDGQWVYGMETYTSTMEQSLERIHPDDVHVRFEMIERVRNEDVPYETEVRMKTTGRDDYRWVLSRGRAVYDENGRKCGIRGTAQDIHDRKMMEMKLAQIQARLDRTTRGTNDGLWEIDLRTLKPWVSPRYAEMLGYEFDEYLTEVATSIERTFGVSHPEDIVIAKAAFDKHIAGGPPVDLEMRKQTKNGEWRWFRVRGACERDEQGNALTVSGSQQDVTERRQYQQALIDATATASAASKAKSEFLANMSHEIRTPMNGVIGMTELLLETPMTPMQRDYAETVRDSAAALLTVINDILDFSKVEAGKLDLEVLDMDMRDTIEDVARLLAIQAHPKGLEVTALLDPNLPDLMRGDAGRVRQILLNLGGNAVKFTSQGEVAIDCRVIEKDERSTLIRCEIRDTGIGIPPERLGALFQPFTQVDTSTTRRFGGTGLGLSIVRRIVELMGGETGVTSEVGVGSTFWFTMRFGAAQHASLTPTPPPAVLKGQRVLVVDDNATNRKVIMGQLMLCHMECVCASSGDEAIALMRQAAAMNKPFEVALLDHQMPGCDGAKLGRLIVADDSLRSTRLVLLTSSGQRGDGQLFAELGFAGYLLKPVTQRDLVDCLTVVLSSRAESWHGRSQPIVTRHALRSNRAQQKFRLLLAEDNPVNQKVACRTLEKLGFRVDVAVNGQAAVDAWATNRYDLILMDCQMPVLDGYEATRIIRGRESRGQGRRIPIVALTAHAIKGADDECTAAGMDDYLSKPIDRLQLTACLDKWLMGMTQTSVITQPLAQLTNDAPIDWDQLLRATADDHDLAHELATLFISSGISTLDDIVTALESGDYGRLGEKAHELQGASANLQAVAATTAALRLEIAARNGDIDQIPELTVTLRREIERAIDFLKQRVEQRVA